MIIIEIILRSGFIFLGCWKIIDLVRMFLETKWVKKFLVLGGVIGGFLIFWLPVWSTLNTTEKKQFDYKLIINIIYGRKVLENSLNITNITNLLKQFSPYIIACVIIVLIIGFFVKKKKQQPRRMGGEIQ